MRLRKIGVVYRKEMVDSLRDRRTIVSMFVAPILLMPLLTIGMGVLTGMQMAKVEQAGVRIAVLGQDHGPSLTARLRGTTGLEIIEVPDYRSALETRLIQVAIDLPEGFESGVSQGHSAHIAIYFDAAEMLSGSAAGKVEATLKDYAATLVQQRLREAGLASDFAEPLVIDKHSLASREKLGGLLIGMFLPYLILILAMTGAMYPAIDLTAGEKERGTLETLLLSAASRFELVMGKFLTVLTTSFVAALLASLSMLATMKAGFGVLPGVGEGAELAVSPLSIALIFVIMIPVCCFFSGLLISVALFAKSYKEATSYLSPLISLLIIPAVVSVLPGMEMGPTVSLIPIINTSIAFKEILMGKADWYYLSIVFLVNLVLAMIALIQAVRLFNQEGVLFRY